MSHIKLFQLLHFFVLCDSKLNTVVLWEIIIAVFHQLFPILSTELLTENDNNNRWLQPLCFLLL